MGRTEHIEKLKLCVYRTSDSFFSEVERNGNNTDFYSALYWDQDLFYLAGDSIYCKNGPKMV